MGDLASIAQIGQQSVVYDDTWTRGVSDSRDTSHRPSEMEPVWNLHGTCMEPVTHSAIMPSLFTRKKKPFTTDLTYWNPQYGATRHAHLPHPP